MRMCRVHRGACVAWSLHGVGTRTVPAAGLSQGTATRMDGCRLNAPFLPHLPQDKYPEVVHLPEGAASSCMGVRSACQPGFELVIVWRMHMEEEGKVFPKLDLLPKVPQQALELDQHHVLETAPLRFRTLLGVLGIEAALESLITSLCPADNQVPANTQVCDFIPRKQLPASREKPRL
ncbi:Centromere protein P [Vulpes lagopus]